MQRFVILKIMKYFHLITQTLARFFISAVFLVGGVKNILHWHETEKSIMGVLLDWQSYIDFSQEAQIFFSILISWSALLQLVATVLMLTGAILLLLGIREKLGAWLLILFLVPVTILYHPFWWMDGIGYEMQAIMFLKNLAILGCLIQILLQNSSSKTMREPEEREQMPHLRF